MNLKDIDKKIDDHAKLDLMVQEQINSKLDMIIENHLAHMEPDLSALKSQMKIVIAVLLMLLTAYIKFHV